jgi:glycosyltransferase involved in cell wall biosynthesis
VTFVDAEAAAYSTPPHATPSIAIVMPAFNEADRIAQTFDAIATYVVRTGRPLPIFLADDGSADRTTGVAWAAAERLGLDLEILRMPHRGKALTVRDAMIAVSGRIEADLLMMLDADNEIAIDQLEHVAWSDDGRTVYIARRVAEAHGALGATPPPIRRLMSSAMRLAARTLLGLPFTDTQCGFKLFPRALAFELFSQQRSTGWVFDAEILVIARASGLPIREVPVVWQPRGVSRVRTSAAATSAVGLLQIAGHRWIGRYRRVGRPGSSTPPR